MLRVRFPPLLLLVLISTWACEEDPLSQIRQDEEMDGGTGVVIRIMDTGVHPDAGPSPEDATVTPPVDSGPPPDTGMQPEPDAGIPDTGPPRECYTEPFDPTVDVSDLRSQWTSGNAFTILKEALRRRYPAGYDLLEAEQNDPYTGSFVDRSSFGASLETAMTETHEATHGWNYGHSLFPVHFDYWLRADLQHSLGFEVQGFARSQIHSMINTGNWDIYRNLYFTGEQGTRGLLELLDETDCYINGLGAIAATADQVPYGISGRDGAVAFLYYVALYLKRGRAQDPNLYTAMLANQDLREHLKIQWLRTHFFLMFADQEPHVGIRDDDFRMLLYEPDVMGEFADVIGRCIDQTNCLCD